jgi:hypothetical protein
MENFFKALKEYEELKKTIGSSDKHSFPLVQAKKDVEIALIEIIDRRIKTALGRDKRSQTLLAKPASELSADAVAYIDALNSAPNPPNVDELIFKGDLTGWFNAYDFWWNDKRKRALK